MMPVVDLTRVLAPGMPVYPGDPGVQFRRHADYRSDGFRVTEVRLGTHAGTHVDAPAHFLPGGRTVADLLPEALFGPARVMALDSPAQTFECGERVLFRSGWASRWGEDRYFSDFPGVGCVLADKLAEAPVALIGLETPSLHPDHDEDARLHRLLLERGIVIVENLINLHLLPERFFLAALPLPFAGLDGAPARVMALAEELIAHPLEDGARIQTGDPR